MSELMNRHMDHRSIRRQLLATVSALALLVSLDAAQTAQAEDEADRPTVWIELGGQLEQSGAMQDPFSPLFLLKTPRPAFETVHPLDAERPPLFSIGGEGKVTFEPEGTNWVFSASVRYGRSNGNKVVHQQTIPASIQVFAPSNLQPPYDDNYANTNVTYRQSHAVIDFSAGKDLGLGMFGRDSKSTFSLGVRYAQFASKTTVNIRERPDMHVVYESLGSNFKIPFKYFHSYALTGQSTRNLRGIGPSLSWDASAPFAGNPETTEFTFDWGLNAAVLFGRQKAAVSHHTSGRYVKVKYGTVVPAPYETGNARNDKRAVTIPNLGGFAGVSIKFPNAKVSLGYRADFFFGAVDGGIDARKRENAGFYGPFASVSVGIGG